MQYIDIRQPIEMIAFFSGAKLKPLRFRWKGQVYKVRRVNGTWFTDEGIVRHVHYSVKADVADSCELCFNSRDLNWTITRIAVE
jgi:hypothetical protein